MAQRPILSDGAGERFSDQTRKERLATLLGHGARQPPQSRALRTRRCWATGYNLEQITGI
jgi:hypothetical protein